MSTLLLDTESAESACSEDDYSESDVMSSCSEDPQEEEKEETESEEDLSLESSSYSGSVSLLKDAPELTKQELIRQLQLKQHIDKLKSEVSNKEAELVQLRMQLDHCHENKSLLLGEEAAVSREMTGLTGPPLGLLHGRQTKVALEIKAEGEVEEDIQAAISRLEREVLEAKVAAAQFSELEKELAKGQTLWKEMKKRELSHRLQNETRLVDNAIRMKAAREREANKLKAQQKAVKSAMEEARKANEEKRKFLNKSLHQYKLAKAKAQEEHREHLEQRMKAVVSLKDNISSSEATMQAQQLLKREKKRQEEAKEEVERKRILEEGGNPEEELLRRKRLQEFVSKLEEFKATEKKRKLELVAKLLRESKQSNKQMKQKLSQPHQTKRVQKRQKKKREQLVLETTETGAGAGSADECAGPETEVLSELLLLGDTGHILKPEIKGLWEDQDGNVEGETPVITVMSPSSTYVREKSKAELEMMKTAMNKLKQSVITKQIAAGREFKGQAFTSKPEVVVFKDFDLDETYQQRVKLTNVSYTVNYCRLDGVSDNLKDFITINFNPPGSLSAGMTCSMQVSFKPKVEEDIEGEIVMLAQTGAFSIPIKCLMKRCVVSIDRTEVDFGSVCVGESVWQKVTLQNAGALSTKFIVITNGEYLPEDIWSLVCGPSEGEHVGTGNRLAEKSDYSIMSNVEPSKAEVAGVSTSPIKSKSEGLISAQIEPVHDDKQTEQEQDMPKQQDTPSKAQPKRQSQPTKQDSVKSQLKHQDTVVRPISKQKTRAQDTPDDQDMGVKDARDRDSGVQGTGVQDIKPSDTEVLDTESAVQDTAVQDSEEVPRGESVVVEESLGGASTVPTAIQVRGPMDGVLFPFDSHAVELVFSPEAVMEYGTKFFFHFSHPSVTPVEITAGGCGIDLPVYVEEDTIDLHICMLERLYQSSIVLYNRTSTSRQVTFQVPVDLQPHLEVLPKHGVVQADVPFSAQLKFRALPSLLEEPSALRYSHEDGTVRVWRLPLEVIVKGQSRSIPFTVEAQVTPSDLTFSPQVLDFGACTLLESVVVTVTMTNSSALPQSFGFVNLPSCVDVQPDDGFGKILAGESLQFDIIFSAKKPKEYAFSLVCKSGIDRNFKIKCKGRGILPPLEMTPNAINFRPTVLGCTSTAMLTLTNHKLSHLNSAVIRGEAPPQGIRAFQFSPPEDSPVTFSPQVGVVPVGQSVSVQVQVCPRIPEESISDEALRLAGSQKVCEPDVLGPSKKKLQLGTSQASLKVPSKGSLASSSTHSTKKSVKEEPPDKRSEFWLEAYHNLFSSYSNRCLQFSIPCFVSDTITDAVPPSASNPLLPAVPPSPTNSSHLSYNNEHTLYLEVTTPLVKPSLVLARGQSSAVDFGEVGTGDVAVRTVTVENISSSLLNLSSSLLNPCGPFQLRNALRSLHPSQSHQLILQFSSQSGGKSYDTLTLLDGDTDLLELRLLGSTVVPEVSLSLGTPDMEEHKCLDMGHVMAKDTLVKTVTLINKSPIKVRFKLNMESASSKTTKSFRACNYSCQPPFVCSPCEGALEAGEVKEVSVTFAPDHQSHAFSDRILVEYNQRYACSVGLKGQAWTNNMYVGIRNKGSQQRYSGLLDERETLISEVEPTDEQSSSPSHSPEPLLLMFHHHTGDEESSLLQHELLVGCIKSSLVKKATSEFSIDAIASSNPFAKCFTFELLKGSVEAGSSKTVLVSFNPPKDVPCSLVAANTVLTLKGHTNQVYQLLLRALMSE